MAQQVKAFALQTDDPRLVTGMQGGNRELTSGSCALNST